MAPPGTDETIALTVPAPAPDRDAPDAATIRRVASAYMDTLARTAGAHAGWLERVYFDDGPFLRVPAGTVAAHLRRRLAAGETRDATLVLEACKSLERDAPEVRALLEVALARFLDARDFDAAIAVGACYVGLAGGLREASQGMLDMLWFVHLRAGDEAGALEVLETWIARDPAQPAPLVWRAVIRADGDPARLADELRASGADLGLSTPKGNVIHAHACADIGARAAGERGLRLAAIRRGGVPDAETFMALSNLAPPEARLRHMRAALDALGVAAEVVAPCLEGLRFAAPPAPVVPPGRGTPLVSVVMTAWQAEAYLETAMRGVLAQSHAALELIVVDDASTDGTAGVVARLAAGDARVRPLRMPVNGGTYVAKNLGLRAARGRWLTLCDSDDVWTPDHLARHVEFMRANAHLACSVSRWVRIDDRGRFDASMRGTFAEACPHSTFFRRDVFDHVGRFDAVRFGADREFVTRLERHLGAGSVGRLDAILTIGRRHGASLTSSGAGRLDPLNRSAARLRYWRDWNRWHVARTIAGARLHNAGLVGADRPYPVADGMQP